MTAGSTSAIFNSEHIFPSSTTSPTALQLAPDDKIYNVNYNSIQISRINAPNLLGVLCDYESNAVQLIDGAKSGFGLPSFFSSIFNYSSSIFSSNHCFGDSSLFSVNTSPDSVSWNFGDPASRLANTSDLDSPTHQFSAPGVYSVTATVFLLDSVLAKQAEITITTPEVNFGNDSSLCNGDSLVLYATNSNATYFWQDSSTSDTLKVNTEGLYWVEVNQGQCTVADSIFIDTVRLALDFGNDTTLCYGGTILLQSNIDSVTNLWQDNSTDSSLLVSNEGLYWLEVNKSTCTSKDSIYIAIDPPVSAILSGGDTTCRGVPFSFAFISTTGLGPFSIEYSNNFNDYFFSEKKMLTLFLLETQEPIRLPIL